jgi:hypothetical protein
MYNADKQGETKMMTRTGATTSEDTRHFAYWKNV